MKNITRLVALVVFIAIASLQSAKANAEEIIVINSQRPCFVSVSETEKINVQLVTSISTSKKENAVLIKKDGTTFKDFFYITYNSVGGGSTRITSLEPKKDIEEFERRARTTCEY